MPLPSFGLDDEAAEATEAEPISPLAIDEALIDDDELLPGSALEDDVEGQVECFLETLPVVEAHKVVNSLLESASSKGVEETEEEQSDRIEESCEFLLRLLEFCPSAEKRQAVLETWLRNNPHDKRGKKTFSPATSTDFLELRRIQRLNSNVMTPAVSMRAEEKSGKPKCFGRGEPGDHLYTVYEFAPVQEAFRSHDQQCPGSIDAKCLAKVLRVGGLTDDEIAKLLQGAGVSTDQLVDYEAFLQWMFKS
ncbi:unnamed protein product [Durusdinium trenchii]|uniref:EF-hand domain-containing protein n=2 Tax=Durusdinium trenchii TaxID=1381693 RepID=A0ABP0NDZ4_9DINO